MRLLTEGIIAGEARMLIGMALRQEIEASSVRVYLSGRGLDTDARQFVIEFAGDRAYSDKFDEADLALSSLAFAEKHVAPTVEKLKAVQAARAERAAKERYVPPSISRERAKELLDYIRATKPKGPATITSLTTNEIEALLMHFVAYSGARSAVAEKPLQEDMDAARWAREFKDVLSRNPGLPHDEGWMISWFANAIMCGYDEANRRHQRTASSVELIDQQMRAEQASYRTGYVDAMTGKPPQVQLTEPERLMVCDAAASRLASATREKK